MRKADSTDREIRKELIKLHNTIHWDLREGDKVYMDNVHVAIDPFRFATRQVILRFGEGPKLDFCLVDMDCLVLAYLKLRGIKPPRQLCELANCAAPPRADFIVPKHLMPNPPKRPRSRR